MHLGRRMAISGTVVAIIAAGAAPALAKGGGGGGGSGGGGFSGKPIITFKAGSYNVMRGSIATITLTRNGTGAASSVIVEPSGPAVGTAGPGNPCTPGSVPPDYQTGTGSSGGGWVANFSSSATSASVLIQTCGDSAYSGNTLLNLSLDGFNNGAPGPKNSATLSINDRHAAPTVKIGNAPPVVEGTQASFPVSINGNTTVPINLAFTTVDGTALSGVNYVGFGPGPVTVTLGPSNFVNFTAPLPVATLNDNQYDPALTFKVALSATGATVSGSPATGTITDAGPTINAGNGSAWQGSPVGIPLTLSYPVPFNVTVHWATAADGTGTGGASCATNPDFVQSSGTATFLANTTSDPTDVVVPTCPPADVTTPAFDKTFGLQLSSPSFGSVGAEGSGLIKSTVPSQTIVQANANVTPAGNLATETATVLNESGEGIPGVTVRGELWRDNDLSYEFAEVDGFLFASTSPTTVTDANGQVISTYTDGTTGDFDYLVVCVPGLEGAVSTDCNVDTGGTESDGETFLNLPGAPGTTAYATELWQ